MRRLSSSFLPRARSAGLVLALAAAAACGRQATSAGDTATPAYLNPKLPVAQRVDDLVTRMTLDEKISQMRDHAPAIPRLSVPKYEWWNEGLHGVAFADDATNFPQVIGMAATWDTDLVHRMGQVVSTEARAKYNQAIRDGRHEMFFGLTFWAPNVNIFRDPRWGRGQETYGEDPYLSGRMGVAFVTGMQGDDPHLLPRRLDAEALRRAQRARAPAPRLQRGRVAARPLGHVRPGLPRCHHRGARAVGDVRLQRRRRASRLREPDAAAGAPAQGLGLRRVRDVRLCRGRRRRIGPQVRPRLRPRLRRSP